MEKSTYFQHLFNFLLCSKDIEKTRTRITEPYIFRSVPIPDKVSLYIIPLNISNGTQTFYTLEYFKRHFVG